MVFPTGTILAAHNAVHQSPNHLARDGVVSSIVDAGRVYISPSELHMFRMMSNYIHA